MARPVKKGLDYYPKNTNVFSDRKIKKLINEFGAKGYLIYEYLLCVIYSEKGYYVEYDVDLFFDIASDLGNGINKELVEEVINGCFRMGLLDENLFKMFKIYSSSGIQKRYLLAKRNAIIREEFSVIAAETPVIAVETPVIAAETPVIAAESTQRKEKKRKENKINENEFIDIWKRARKYYDKKECGFNKLEIFEKQCFNQLLKDGFKYKDFEFAVAGLFFQDTVPPVRVRPDWLLKPENFSKMLDCWKNKTKIFSNKKEIKAEGKFKTGDV